LEYGMFTPATVTVESYRVRLQQKGIPMTTISLGYTIFCVHDVAQTVRFFTTAFGLEARFVTPEGPRRARRGG